LGSENLFMVAVGPLAGTGAPQLGRISIGAKSPLTLGIKEANAGGPAAQWLDRLGIRAIVVQGAPPINRLYNLFISKNTCALIPADEYRGLKNYELASRLRKKYGEKIAILSIGPAGERKYRGASVSLTDIFGDPSRNAAGYSYQPEGFGPMQRRLEKTRLLYFQGCGKYGYRSYQSQSRENLGAAVGDVCVVAGKRLAS
jgi:aldehyde:ferredoxin oxidoreductase